MDQSIKITLFLIDGDRNKRLSCELSNWIGKAYKIPRNLLGKSRDILELQTAGVYMLLNKGTELSKEGDLYIGEAENVYTRLIQHLKEKDFWSEVIVFISKDKSLNKAQVKYLENRLYSDAKNVDRYNLLNNQIPTQSNLSDPDKSEMEEFLLNAKILVNTLGYKPFEEIIHSDTNNLANNEEDLFYISAARNASGKGKATSEGFVVLKGSQVSDSVTNSFPSNMQKLRDLMIAEGVIVNQNDKLIIKKNYLFNSPSSAAMIIMGRSANGLTEWKTKSGKILQECEIE